ncbi:MAG: hypothetical protein AAFQ40_14425, partial [Cyanobacteria bacterium J06623_5]
MSAVSQESEFSPSLDPQVTAASPGDGLSYKNGRSNLSAGKGMGEKRNSDGNYRAAPFASEAVTHAAAMKGNKKTASSSGKQPTGYAYANGIGGRKGTLGVPHGSSAAPSGYPSANGQHPDTVVDEAKPPLEEVAEGSHVVAIETAEESLQAGAAVESGQRRSHLKPPDALLQPPEQSVPTFEHRISSDYSGSTYKDGDYRWNRGTY